MVEGCASIASVLFHNLVPKRKPNTSVETLKGPLVFTALCSIEILRTLR